MTTSLLEAAGGSRSASCGAEHHRFRVVAVHVQHRRADHLGRRRCSTASSARRRRRLVVKPTWLLMTMCTRAADARSRAPATSGTAPSPRPGRRTRRRRGSGSAAPACGSVSPRRFWRERTRAGDHRVDDFQVRRIERQRQVHRAARGGDVGGEAHVVLHVAGVRGRRRTCSNLPSNSSNSWRGGLPSVLISTLRRPRWAMPMTTSLARLFAGAADSVVHQRDQRVAAFQREALLADVLGVQVALQAFGGGEALEDALLVFGGASRTCRRRFSRRSCIQRRCSASVMCMNSAPIGAGVGGLEQRDAGRAASCARCRRRRRC